MQSIFTTFAFVVSPVISLRRFRVRAGVSYALTEAMDEGHCGLPTQES